MCIYIHTCIYTHVYICIYINIYIPICIYTFYIPHPITPLCMPYIHINTSAYKCIVYKSINKKAYLFICTS